uniref:Uncharacterized protein n=1 Tax=Timema douglasi TaxID=61478 RepID=A0A7R8VJS5_TIMDO|nr:unnamed protein product [Timema douglasi]
MEGITSVKIEPLEDFEYNFQQEEKFEIKSEVDVQIKSEECFKEEFNDYQQPECWPGPTTLLPIKEELTSEIDLPIKSEEGFEEELNYYQQPECWSGPPIKGELPSLCLSFGSLCLTECQEDQRAEWLLMQGQNLNADNDCTP